MDPVKVAGVHKWPILENRTDMQAFVDFVNFYCCFIQDFSTICQVQGRTGAEWARVEWNYSGIEGFDHKMRNNLGLSSCAVPQSTVVYVVAYFRRTELLPGVLERSGID